ncbi:armadillo-type protein [Myxozyma melibiosi]|uniref:Armadillo-type protein n=1 Tax=Myxozyma melibiosi TaxID=54550 RepID=A0ABR1FFQ1_9ASCO
MSGLAGVSLKDILPELGSNDLESRSRSLAFLQLAALLQTDKSGTTASDLKAYLLNLLDENKKKSLVSAFLIMTSLFHIDTGLASEIFIEATRSKASQLSGMQLDDSALSEGLLEMLSAACVDKKCRSEVEKNYATVISSALESQSASPAAQALAASILIKLTATPRPPSTSGSNEGEAQLEADINTLTDLLRDTVISSKGANKSFTIAAEGLTYSSLNVSVKRKLIKDTACLKVLLQALKDKQLATTQPAVIYGILPIFQNLTAYPELMTKEKEQVAKLRSYANNGKDAKEDEEKTEDFTKRCKVLLDLGIISSLAACAPSASPNAQKAIGAIMKNLVTEKSHRSLVVQQGGISILLAILKPPKTASQNSGLVGNFKIQIDESPNLAAAVALARLLISVNPALAFSTRNSPTVAVGPLLGLIDLTSDNLTLLDSFEALLALTNLASMETGSIGDVITTRGWDKIEACLLSDNKLIQRASSELLCNLSGSPETAAKYLDKDDKAHVNRIRILVALADSEDDKTRRGAAGALAILTQWAPAGDVFLENEKNLKGILHILKDEDQEVLIRGAVCVNNLLCGAQGNATVEPAAKVIKSLDGLQIIEETLKRPDLDGQVRAALEDSRERILSVT